MQMTTADPMLCARCETALTFIGTRDLHGIGEELRPEPHR
jgi:hypothetical protein